MAKQDNTIFWIIGIVLFLIVATSLPSKFPFAIITKTTCISDSVSYHDFDSGYTNLVAGKIGNAIEFNGNNSINLPISTEDFKVMWIKNYTRGDTDYFFVADLNGTNYVNAVQSTSRQIIPIGLNFGLGFNGSVDEIGTFTDLSVETMKEIYNNGTGRKICVTTSFEENVTCKDYATEQVTDTGTGCLSYSGAFFPSCDYQWEATSKYKLVNNQCDRQFYCSDGIYSLSDCEAQITTITSVATIQDTIPQEEGRLNQTLTTIRGFDIKIWHLIILLVIIGTILYFQRKK